MKKFLFVLPLLFINAGCYVGANALPKVKNEQLKSENNRSSVVFDIKLAHYKRAEEIKSPELPALQKRFEKILLQSEMFSSVAADESKSADYQFHFKYIAIPDRNKELSDWQFTNAILSGVTIGFFPMIVSDFVDLYVDVEKDGTILKHYQYREKIDQFAWSLVGIVGMVFVPTSVREECEANMIRNFLYDIKKEDILKTPER
jgi:hypothetical protein